ncbi:hypothetical protein A3D01_05650 [Candidatus Woesebacteria bacterium RIFCSPHIGHO2_02_FULL_39_13]|uniref:N-acetyltransferase domain-containing protein n=1 Tax=Candidatus Woesebacteria bacterium RIFCSPHIGHO2_02_FULL_39_13 TaxID=1802505 RepID=A0A1F7Z0G3_9BACT|nr:MAG: hypothetical protein A2692_05045 [Candidatus Woesebacteria bacterium RIFCSPHIGHO2_01_FULL_39_95]OGM32980.1 MAG: hypothetical protein A3D01_05650 [Candidatus Woesebacteria bacterium RIFCSPHIGHO2_02_FULL_39_13]OGM36942.1 MAG: hypothetical protein A3E13_01465 [Candidatus Woesebacteria bacterium RIFCSPHIGHO2_12_FULL_40_20]
MVTKNITFNQVKTLSDALHIRRIRNECRTFLTNNTNYISLLQQVWWFLTYYRSASKNGIYRMFIARNNENRPVGYGAFHRVGKELLVTECVSKRYRHQSYGQAILEELIKIAKREGCRLKAEIRDSNKISIALHEKFKFKLYRTKTKSGVNLLIYRL